MSNVDPDGPVGDECMSGRLHKFHIISLHESGAILCVMRKNALAASVIRNSALGSVMHPSLESYIEKRVAAQS